MIDGFFVQLVQFPDYIITEHGVVWSFRTRFPKIIRPLTNSRGYLQMSLQRPDGSRAYPLLHRLLMRTFVGPSDLYVNHRNGIKTDNRLENLEYTTAAENNRHARETGLCPSPPVGGYGSTLTTIDVVQIRALVDAGYKQKDIAAQYGVTPSTVCAIAKGLTWKGVS